MSIIEARIKNFTYENDESPTLHAIDLNIEEGELVVLTGFSGCGKTTLTRILNGLIPYHYGGILDGEVRILGKNILDYKKGELAKYIGNVFQNPSDQFFATIAEEEVAFAGENLGMDFQTLCEKTDAAFQTMQIESLKGAKLSELSGGQKQKVAIASTLIYDTKLLFFDEPSSNLDYEGIVQFQAMIRDLKAMGKTIIIAEHRLFFLNELYDKLIYMKDGTIEKIFLKGELTTEDCRRYGLRAIRYDSLVCENPSVPKQAVTHIENLSISVGRGGRCRTQLRRFCRRATTRAAARAIRCSPAARAAGRRIGAKSPRCRHIGRCGAAGQSLRAARLAFRRRHRAARRWGRG